jgi:hypothetical protein
MMETRNALMKSHLDYQTGDERVIIKWIGNENLGLD